MPVMVGGLVAAPLMTPTGHVPMSLVPMSLMAVSVAVMTMSMRHMLWAVPMTRVSMMVTRVAAPAGEVMVALMPVMATSVRDMVRAVSATMGIPMTVMRMAAPAGVVMVAMMATSMRYIMRTVSTTRIPVMVMRTSAPARVVMMAMMASSMSEGGPAVAAAATVLAPSTIEGIDAPAAASGELRAVWGMTAGAAESRAVGRWSMRSTHPRAVGRWAVVARRIRAAPTAARFAAASIASRAIGHRGSHVMPRPLRLSGGTGGRLTAPVPRLSLAPVVLRVMFVVSLFTGFLVRRVFLIAVLLAVGLLIAVGFVGGCQLRDGCFIGHGRLHRAGVFARWRIAG